MDLLAGRRRLMSAGSGGRPRTQELLEFCAEQGLGADIETVPPAQISEALERLERGDVRYRFVLGTADLSRDG